MQNRHKIKLIKIHKNIATKNPPFAPQLSDVCKKQPKNPPVIPYNCQICGKLMLLLIFVAWWFYRKLMRYKPTHSLPNCRNHSNIAHFVAIKHLPLAPQLSICVVLGWLWVMVVGDIFGWIVVGFVSCWVYKYCYSLMFWYRNGVDRWCCELMWDENISAG